LRFFRSDKAATSAIAALLRRLDALSLRIYVFSIAFSAVLNIMSSILINGLHGEGRKKQKEST
jgi:hypothetical protein